MTEGCVNSLLLPDTCISPSTEVQPFTLKEIVSLSPIAAVNCLVTRLPVALPVPNLTAPPA